MAKGRIYICLDLKSFYASVECVERGLDPLTADLVVADPERTEKTICLAVTPHMKAQGVHNRCRVFEIPKSIDYVMAPPRMQLYIDYSAKIYQIYLKYAAAEDIHIYSIDEVFLDATAYLGARGQSAREYARAIMEEVLAATGITATCGIGTNLYLAKIAMDIIAKHSDDHIGVLTEELYRKTLWAHQPMTDFWRVSSGTVRRLEQLGIRNMGEVAMAEEDALYRAFGIDAELLIDHAWGREPTTIADIKAYRPKMNSLTSGQVLPYGYDYEGALLLVREMTELLSLELAGSGLSAASVSLALGYAHGRDLPPQHGTLPLAAPTGSTRALLTHMETLYHRIALRDRLVYHIYIGFGKVREERGLQYDLFSPPAEQERERSLQAAVLDIKQKYGKSGVFRGMDLLEGARTLERNAQIGGHKA